VEAWEVAARVEIADLVARYNAQGDAGRIAQMLLLFSEDATLAADGRVYRGRDEIRGLFDEAAARTRVRTAAILRHFTATHQVDFDGVDHASGRCYFQVVTETGIDHWGRYVDRYARLDEGWRFVHRRVEVEGCVPGGWADGRNPRSGRRDFTP
jgi:hypothetical protein